MITVLREARKFVVLTGAGISAESGIPTFRDALTGLWKKFDAETLGTPEAFQRDPALVWGWYEWRRMKALNAKPNAAHLAIVDLAFRGPQVSLFTQNVDDLHERAGSIGVQHLHGSLLQPRCYDCGHPYLLSDEVPEEPSHGWRITPPKCDICAGWIRPGVVWFNEALPADVVNSAFEAAKSCDVMVVVGTSGVVYPAARLPAVAKKFGQTIIQINSGISELNKFCTWNLRGSAGKLLPALIQQAFS